MPDDRTPALDGLRKEVRAFLADASPPQEVRRLMDTDRGHDPAVWDEIVRRGFVGRPVEEQAVVFEEAGAALLCAPLLGDQLGRSALVAAGAEDRMPAAGAVTALAIAEDSGSWDETGVSLQASRSGSGWRLSGHKSYVIDGHVADVIVVAARTDAGVTLFEVDGDAPGIDRRLLPTVDRTRKLARLALSSVPGVPLGDSAEAVPEERGVVERVVDLAMVALAAEQVGGAERCLAMTVSHVGKRVQFGRPIGMFQAVQHRCADMLLELESARSASAWATQAAASRHRELGTAAATAKVCCSEAYSFVATETIHLHGGLGFTWDHDAHLYFKRAKSSRVLFGDPRFHRGRLFDRFVV